MTVTPTLSRRKLWLFRGVLALLLVGTGWSAVLVTRSTQAYLYVKDGTYGWRGRVVAWDRRLGYAPIPGTAGNEIVGGVATPVRFDAEGFRIPLAGEVRSGADGPTVLALGCSFTFGSGVPAEQTYAARVADALGGRLLNAGFPGYGLSQMLVQARDLIPRHRPDVVLLQVSTWLPHRASNRYRDTPFDLLPNPYFARGEGGAPVWQPPPWKGKVFDVPIGEYRSSPKGLGDWAGFVARVGVPILVHDDLARAVDAGRHWTGRRVPAADPREIAETVYAEILALCRDAGSRVVVVGLEHPGKQDDPQRMVRWPAGVTVVDTKPGLYAALGNRHDDASYQRAYGQWTGEPPVLVDLHPNGAAHALIAEQVLAAVEPPLSARR